MTPRIKLFFKIFLIIGVPCTIGWFALSSFRGRDFTIFQGIFFFLFTGGLSGWLYTSYQKERIEGLGLKVTSENIKAVQEKEFQFEGNLEKLSDILDKSNSFRNVSFDPVSREIVVKTWWTADSYGERITIKQVGEQRFHMKSQSSFPFQFLDKGKNLVNIVELQKLIKQSA